MATGLYFANIQSGATMESKPETALCGRLLAYEFLAKNAVPMGRAASVDVSWIKAPFLPCQAGLRL